MYVSLMWLDIDVLKALSFGMNLESVNLKVSECNSLSSCDDNACPIPSIVSATSMTYYTLDALQMFETWLEPDVDASAFLYSA